MAEREIATALELMQGGLKFDHDEAGWWWIFREEKASDFFQSQLDAVRDFCQWYTQIRTVKDEPRPEPFDVDKFMMDGIQALALAAAEEMRARGNKIDAQAVAGELARAWHASAISGGWPLNPLTRRRGNGTGVE